MRETQFKKGARTGKAAENWKPIGTILPDPEGYLRIKVREAIHGKEASGFGNTKLWPLLQRQVWQEHNGPIPPQHVVVFQDGNRANCAIENLECIHRKELARRNCMWNRYPRELAEAIQLTGALKRKIRKQERRMPGRKNKLSDLRDHLFSTLEGLADEEEPLNIKRAKAICEVAQTIINSAKVEVDMVRALAQSPVDPSTFFEQHPDKMLEAADIKKPLRIDGGSGIGSRA